MKETITFSQRPDLEINNEILEICFIELDKQQFNYEINIIVGVVYRPPNTDVTQFNEQLSLILNKLKNLNVKHYLVGDYNINLLNYENHIPTSEFVDLMYSYTLFPLIRKPTRIQSNSATLIDNIFSNISLDGLYFNGILVTDVSDHYPVFHIDIGHEFKKEEPYMLKRDICARNKDRF